MYADVYCRDSLLHCDNWQIDLDEHACNRSIATDCNTFWPRWPSSTVSYKTLCTQLTNVCVAKTPCNQLLLIDSATYVRTYMHLKMYLPDACRCTHAAHLLCVCMSVPSHVSTVCTYVYMVFPSRWVAKANRLSRQLLP